MSVAARLLEFVVCLSGGVAAMFGVFAFVGWLLPDSDFGTADAPADACRRCDHPAYRVGLCADHYELAVDSAYTDGEWD